MSRSRKKVPIMKDNGKSNKADKRCANKKVRSWLKSSDEHIANRKSYRKIFESWDIADYICFWSESEAREYYQKREDYLKKKGYNSEDDFINRGYKMKRK